jgi:hypothetical protein
MQDELSASGLSTLPKGFVAVPVSVEQMAAPLRLCVVCRAPGSGEGLIALRDTLDARVLLGCIMDAGRRVHQWVEIWIQSLQNVIAAPGLARESLSNALLDKRWRDTFAAMESLEPDDLFRTGWEGDPPRPTWIDPKSGRPIHPIEGASRKPFALCRDESALAEANLPSYATSLHRYLYVPEHPAQTPFVAITPDAPANERTVPLETLVPPGGGLVPLNPGGLTMVRSHSPLTLEAFSDMLSGKPAAGTVAGVPNELQTVVAAGDAGNDGDGWLSVGRHGRWGRVIESLHLKLRVLADVVNAVRTSAQRTQRPLLSLDADQFKIRIGPPATALPRLWTARAVLADAGSAVELPVQGSAARHYTPGGPARSPVYQPARGSEVSRGQGTVRIRKVFPEMAEGVVVEGTLDSQQKVDAARNDLVWLRITMPDAPLDLYARVDPGPALAGGEWRFRTVGQRLAPARVAQLREGLAAAASFEVIPVLSSPVDLYSIGVLATRLLLVNAAAALPVALDEILSLARELANQHDAHSPLPLRVRAIVESDPRWLAALGPQRLQWEGLTPEHALEMVPADLWMDVLGTLVAMFPGVGPDSACRDYGDAPPGALHRVFDRAIADLDRLLLRTRSLIVIDWRYNREIHSIIRGYLTGLAQPTAPAAQAAPAPPPAPTAKPAMRVR